MKCEECRGNLIAENGFLVCISCGLEQKGINIQAYVQKQKSKNGRLTYNRSLVYFPRTSVGTQIERGNHRFKRMHLEQIRGEGLEHHFKLFALIWAQKILTILKIKLDVKIIIAEAVRIFRLNLGVKLRGYRLLCAIIIHHYAKLNEIVLNWVDFIDAIEIEEFTFKRWYLRTLYLLPVINWGVQLDKLLFSTCESMNLSKQITQTSFSILQLEKRLLITGALQNMIAPAILLAAIICLGKSNSRFIMNRLKTNLNVTKSSVYAHTRMIYKKLNIEIKHYYDLKPLQELKKYVLCTIKQQD
jgi:hypothetical protein